jgi:multidrug resistance efflux pump
MSMRISRTSRRQVPVLPEISTERVPLLRLTGRLVRLSVIGVLVFVMCCISAVLLAPISVTVDGAGTLEPAMLWSVRTDEGGNVSRVHRMEGDTVAEGTVIASLDDRLAREEVGDLSNQLMGVRNDISRQELAARLGRSRALAAIEGADVNVTRSRAALRQKMAEFGVFGDPDSLSQSVFEENHVGLSGARADFSAAKLAVRAATSDTLSNALADADLAKMRIAERQLALRLESALARVQRANITSPGAGVILTPDVHRLQGTAVTPGQQLVEVADTSAWKAVVSVSESDLHLVRLGDAVDVEVSALSSLTTNRFAGRVERISWLSGTASNRPIGSAAATASIGYSVVVLLDTSSTSWARPYFRKGFEVRAHIVAKRDVLWRIAMESVRERLRTFSVL